MKPCATEADVRCFEQTHGVALPNGYRRFLLEIGDGGDGPYHGLHSLATALPAPPADVSRPFLLTGPTSLRPVEKRSRLAYRRFETGTDPHDGCLVLCEQGCATYDLLTVTGDHPDRVWLSANDGVLHPRGQGFLDWYEAWLDE